MEKSLQKIEPQSPERMNVSTLSILDAAVRGGINKENVEVVERLVAMRREEVSMENKVLFNRAFFALKRDISKMDFYADKAAKDSKGNVAFTYCSETEISKHLDPVLFQHGFTMLFGQRQEDGRTVAMITLIHEAGHEETREYSVRAGSTNSMKDATAADTGSTTSAWRHLVIKMFGLKSRIREDDDPRNEGDKISAKQAEELRHRVKMTNSNELAFLKFSGVGAVSGEPNLNHYESIMSTRYAELDAFLKKKEASGR